MALIQKTNPVGVDRMIDRLQTLLYDSLGWTEYDCFPRVYANEYFDSGLIPEHFEFPRDVDISDYTEVFLNDNLYAQSIILIDDMMSVNNKQFKTKANIIFHVNLNDLYPSVEHRADEECHVQVIKAINQIPFVKIEKLVKGLRNVYSGMRVSNILDSDLHPFHCFKLELELVYKYDCKLDSL
jgi:hypothetical protein